jgi:hypothetical protein
VNELFGGIMQELECAKRLSDDELVCNLTRLVRADRVLTAKLVAHVGEVEARGLYRDHGFDSMFNYAIDKLNMSESEAALRIRVARLGRKFPQALEMLSRGELHLTALGLLAPVLTPTNLELLELARFKSKSQVLELIARCFPQPDVRPSIRKLPVTTLPTIAASTPQPSAVSTDMLQELHTIATIAAPPASPSVTLARHAVRRTTAGATCARSGPTHAKRRI